MPSPTSRADVPAVSIGPETTRAARAAGITVLAEAERSDLDGVVSAVEVGLAERP